MASTAHVTAKLAFSRLIAVAALGLMLLATAGTVNGVGAERVPTNGDSQQIGCRALQDRLYALVDEYGRTSPYADRRDEIIAEIRNIGQNWLAAHCDSRYGSISSALELPTSKPGDVDHVGGDLSPDADPGADAPDPLLAALAALDGDHHDNPTKSKGKQQSGNHKHGKKGHKGHK